jgi:hypothetical protein
MATRTQRETVSFDDPFVMRLLNNGTRPQICRACRNQNRPFRNERDGTWIDAGVTAPPKDGSSYLLMARVVIRGGGRVHVGGGPGVRVVGDGGRRFGMAVGMRTESARVGGSLPPAISGFDASASGCQRYTLSFLFLCINHVPVIPISFRNWFLTFASAIARGYGASYLAPLGLGWLCT